MNTIQIPELPDYRAWHPKYRKMYQVKGIMLDSMPALFSIWAYELRPNAPVEKFDDSMAVLLPFTGFVDKHGKKVYKGDIVKAILNDRFNGPEEVTETVGIHEGFLAPFYMRVECEEAWWKDRLVDGFEVIGNIYEAKKEQG